MAELLRGLHIECVCGQRMYRHKTTNGRAYYRCMNRRPDDPDQRHTKPIPSNEPTS